MNFRLKRILWYSGAAIFGVAAYIFLNAALHMAWLSGFTHANVSKLQIYFMVYCALFISAATGIIICVKRGNALRNG